MTADRAQGSRRLRREMEKVYDEYGAMFYTCALSVTANPSMAEDAIHEAFSRVLRLKELPRNLKAYMFRSVRNAAIDQIRQKGRLKALPEDYIFQSSASGPSKLVEQKQFKEQVAKALMKLSEDERETIVEHIYGQLTFQEISDIRERSLGTVTSWYRRGIVKLKDYLEQ